MSTQTTIGAGALAQAPVMPTMGAAALPTRTPELRREDARTRAASLRAFNPNPPAEPLPLWKRCLCWWCLLQEEIERLERVIEQLELQLLQDGMSLEELASLYND